MEKSKKFDEFIGEAYVDSEGNLGGFEITDDEALDIESSEHIEDIKVFLEAGGAYSVRHTVDNGKLQFSFRLDMKSFVIIFDLNHDFAVLQRISNAPTKVEMLYGDTLNDFMDKLTIDGLSSMMED